MKQALIESFIFSDGFGKLIFIGLWTLSALGWWVIIEKIRWLNAVKQSQGRFFEKFHENQAQWIQWLPQDTHAHAIYEKLYRTIVTQCRNLIRKNQALTQEDRAFLSMEDLEIIDYQANSSIEDMIHLMKDRLSVLVISISLAPFLGLLGTVWGMLSSFYQMHGQAMSLNNEKVFEGLSMALATTVVGLLVAIPALVSYHLISQKISTHKQELLKLKASITELAQIQYRLVSAPLPSSPRTSQEHRYAQPSQ